jgi:hypothetical protein
LWLGMLGGLDLEYSDEAIPDPVFSECSAGLKCLTGEDKFDKAAPDNAEIIPGI